MRVARWTSDDVDFPGLWTLWPLICLAALVLSAVLAVLVDPWLVLIGPTGAAAAFAAAWGPRGLTRQSANTVKALSLGLAIFIAEWAMLLLLIQLTT